MSTLYKPRKPVKKESETKKSRQWFYHQERQKLRNRCGARCDWCGVSLLEIGGDPDHLWGREGTGARLGYPFCHLSECLAALCRHCHDERPTDPQMDWTLKYKSLIRLEGRFGVSVGKLYGEEDLIPFVRRIFAGVSAEDILDGRR